MPAAWNRKLLSESSTRYLSLVTLVDDIPIKFVKTGPGIFFCITVSEDGLRRIASAPIAEFLSSDMASSERLPGGGIVIGRIVEGAKDGTPNGAWPTVEDKPLEDHVNKAVSHFWHMIDHFGCWSSFNNFLATDIDYKLDAPDQLEQLRLEYWWLTGPLGKSYPTHKCSGYPNKGVFVRPSDGAIPIFSSDLYADMASQRYSREFQTRLVPEHIGCLGCFLQGLSGELGRQVISCGELNGQWRIKFYTCEKSQEHSDARHFWIRDDDGCSYALVGCKDAGRGPAWFERRWDSSGQWFRPECNPKPW